MFLLGTLVTSKTILRITPRGGLWDSERYKGYGEKEGIDGGKKIKKIPQP
jgi:hypothetical protein